MSGICGKLKLGASLERVEIEPMLAQLQRSRDEYISTVTRQSAALGLAQRWTGQALIVRGAITVAVDSDLCNLAEIRNRLSQEGIAARDMSEPELIAALYEIYNLDFVKWLKGSFALAIWDQSSQQLVLGVDRFGIKGLTFSKTHDELVFATCAGAVAAGLDVAPDVDRVAVLQFFLFSAVPAPLTIYCHVQRLEPGHLLVVADGVARRRRYWDLNYQEDDARTQSQWAEEVRHGIQIAVHCHLEGCRAHSTGAYLSGGTDSSSVVAFLSGKFQPARTYSIYFEEARYNEIKFARTTASHFRTDHHEKCINAADALDAVQHLIRYFDEPFANSSAVGAYYCAKMARESGIEVLLAGDGGDELFAGNERYATDKRFALYHSIPLWLRRGFIEPIVASLPFTTGNMSQARRYVHRANIPNPRRILSYGMFLERPAEDIFQPEFLEQVPPENWLAIPERHFHAAAAASELNRLLYMDVKMTLADNDLRKVTGTAEMAGIRTRFPLLHHDLAELSARIPTRFKLSGFEKRYIFKQAMRGVLPETVLNKKKHGFGVPLATWMLSDRKMNALLQDVLSDSRVRQRGYLRPEFLEQLRYLHGQRPSYYGEILWYIVALELWHREHYDNRCVLACKS